MVGNIFKFILYIRELITTLWWQVWFNQLWHISHYNIPSYLISMFGQFKSRKPPKNFNLLYLESNEVYFMSLKASLIIDSTSEQVDGKIHLCSRSIFFEHKNIDKPIIRFKFSCGVLLRMLKNIDLKKVYKLTTIRKPDNQLKAIFSKGANYISQLLEKEQADASKKIKVPSESLLTKLYQPLKKKAGELDDKINNCFFIRVPKLLVIYRKPISPYITQKIEQNLVFQLYKTNNKIKVLRFLKIYDEISKCMDEDRLVQSIVNATVEESTEQLLQMYSDQKLEASSIIRCKRVKIEGNEYGQMVLLKNIVKYYPLINSPDFEQIEFTYNEIKYINRYRYMFEEKAIEIWLYNYPYSILFNFSDHQTRQFVYKNFKEKADKLIQASLSQISSKWSDGEISNIQYINYLNVFANRSQNDLSQYPVFPWVFHTYDGEFDLKNPELFRDLTKPIGAINKHRLRKLKDFYEMQTKDKTVTNPPHIYSTHYSTPGYVAYYLIRRIPEFIVRLQNGVFNPSDRIFRCLESAYYSSMNSAADFKQLTPEFYSTDCDFLVNSQKLEMGSTPEGEVIDDVILPKWAKNAEDFLMKSRTAFESDMVSSHLHEWIDLVFGFKQSGTQAITYDNVFYHLTYQQNVNFDRPMSRMERAALEVQVSEFGQTPIKLFESQHFSKKTRIIHLDLNVAGDNKKFVNAKIIALTEQNQRLQEKLERQKHRFNKKLNEKEQILMRNNKEKKKDLQHLRETLQIDDQSLKRFSFKTNFSNQKEKDIYIRQIEEMIRQTQRKNAEMATIISGMKREVQEEVRTHEADLKNLPQDAADFFDDI